MADEFDLEQEVARLRGKLKALTVITVLFMLASGGLAAAVYMKVSKTPEPPQELRVTASDGRSAALTWDGLEITNGDEHTKIRVGQLDMKIGTGSVELKPNALTLDTKAGQLMLDASVTSTNTIARPLTVLSLYQLYLEHEKRTARITVLDDPPTLTLEVPGKDTVMLQPMPTPPPPAPPAPAPVPAPP
jgi:hypothetical protein